jgi:predicted metalloprotease
VAAELKRLGEVSAPRAGNVPRAPTDPNVERAYLTALFDDVQRVWRSEFATSHLSYHPARLIVFSGQTQSACGPHKDSGPFYCPADEGVYLDLRFFTILLRLAHVGAAAQVFIVGHEVGHHVQRLLGIANHVDAASKADPSRKNALSIQVELQADCLAGVWAKSAYPRNQLNPSSLAEALRTAKVIGDDYIQTATGQVVDAAMWTHGSSAQRQQWLRAGYRSGRPSACNTFAAG